MMQNAMLKTKREGGQIFRLVGLVGSIWQPKLQLCLEGASFSNRHSLCQLLSFWSFSFSLSFQHFPPHILVFSLNTSSPLRVPFHPSPPLLWRIFHSGVARNSEPNMLKLRFLFLRAEWNGYRVTMRVLRYLFFFFLLYPPKCFLSASFLAESGRRCSLGVMVLLWIQVQNKMEDKALLLSNQRREWFHV